MLGTLSACPRFVSAEPAIAAAAVVVAVAAVR